MLILNKILWGITTTMIIMGGFYFSIRLKFIQFRIKDMLSSLISSNSNQEDTISPWESLSMSLAARIGVGSLAGVALAIYVGGVGTIFWLWMSALIAAPNTFSETVLGVVYRRRDAKKIYRGGPPYYIESGLGKPTLAKVAAFIIGFSYIVGFLTIQANTITKSLVRVVNIYPLIIGFVIAFLTGIIIFKGVKQIAVTSSKLVPLMGFIYTLTVLSIVIININKIPAVLVNIIISAFNIKAFGAGVITSLVIGMQRGIFSNESGLGTSAIAAATTTVNQPVSIGLIQMAGVYFTTLIICSATAIAILTSNYDSLTLTDVNGIEITLYAFKYHLSYLGEVIVIVTILLFAFSTIITGYYYGESCLKFLYNNISNVSLFCFRLLTVILLLLGSFISSSFLWQIVDILVAIMAIINLYALLELRRVVILELEISKSKQKCAKI